jgi:hypothetical protein
MRFILPISFLEFSLHDVTSQGYIPTGYGRVHAPEKGEKTIWERIKKNKGKIIAATLVAAVAALAGARHACGESDHALCSKIRWITSPVEGVSGRFSMPGNSATESSSGRLSTSPRSAGLDSPPPEIPYAPAERVNPELEPLLPPLQSPSDELESPRLSEAEVERIVGILIRGMYRDHFGPHAAGAQALLDGMVDDLNGLDDGENGPMIVFVDLDDFMAQQGGITPQPDIPRFSLTPEALASIDVSTVFAAPAA